MELIQENPLRYPVFKADQVLTKDDLNDLFNYLDEQNRLSRVKLIGMGIVCGLEISFNSTNTIISISKGCGITSLGYLIIQEDTDLAYYRPYILPSNVQYAPFTPQNKQVALYELLTADEYAVLGDPTKATALAFNASFLQDKVVVLFLEMFPNDAKNCVSGDCDNAGTTMEISVKRLLISINDLPGATGYPFGEMVSSDNLPDLNLKRFNVPATALKDFNTIYQAYNAIFSTTASGNIIDSLSTALEKLYQLLKPLLTDFPSSPFTQVKNTILKSLSSIRKNVPYGIQYFYDFLDDLIKAYNELKEKSRQLLSECCPDEDKFPLHLQLGLATVNTSGFKSSFRQYFIYSPLYTQQQFLIEELRLLFKRITLMLNSFFVPAATGNANTSLKQQFISQRNYLQIKVTPSNNLSTVLSKRAIPYYYQIIKSDPIQNSWNYVKTIANKANQNLSYNANLYNTLPDGDPYITPLQYSIEKNDFFRIEGHVGQNYTVVLKEITRQINTYRLPFDVVAVKLGDDATDVQPDPACIFNDLEVQYDQLRTDLYCKLSNQSCFYASQNYTSNIFLPIAISGLNINLEAKPAAASLATDVPDITNSSTDLDISGLQLSQVIKYSTYLPVNLRYIFQANVYVKGQFLNSLACFTSLQKPSNVLVSYVGPVYLARLKRGPIPAYTPESINNIPDYLVKLLDLIEEIVATVFYTQLAYFNLDDFTAKFKALTDYVAALNTLLKNNPNANNIPAHLVDYLDKVKSLCDVNKFKTLIDDYQVRWKKLQSDFLFSNFITKHPGIDHKAGVPKGGTFILVYYEKPVVVTQTSGTTSNIGSQLASVVNDATKLQEVLGTINDASVKTTTVRANVSGNVYNDLNNIIHDERYAFTEQQQSAILKYIDKRTTVTTDIQLPDKAVVADFYLPYLCCSDYGGVTYIFPPDPVVLSIGLDPQQFCNNDSRTYPVTVQPAGGVLTGEGIADDGQGNYTFSPSGLTESKKTITYTLDSNKTSIQVDVYAPVGDVSFGFQYTQREQEFVVSFYPSAPDGLQYQWDFGDGTSDTNKTPAAHIYGFDGDSHTYEVTFTVTNGACSTPVTNRVVLTRQVSIAFDINPKRYLFNDRNLYPFTISPMIRQDDIVTEQTSDLAKLFNPSSLKLLVQDDGLKLQPLMPDLQATTNALLQYQNLQLTIEVVKPSARFNINVTQQTGVLTHVPPIVVQFSAIDTKADQYQWTINGNGSMLQPIANPPALTTEQYNALFASGQQVEIVLVTSYKINDTSGDDKKGALLTMEMIKVNLNKGAFEPRYE